MLKVSSAGFFQAVWWLDDCGAIFFGWRPSARRSDAIRSDPIRSAQFLSLRRLGWRSRSAGKVGSVDCPELGVNPASAGNGARGLRAVQSAIEGLLVGAC